MVDLVQKLRQPLYLHLLRPFNGLETLSVLQQIDLPGEVPSDGRIDRRLAVISLCCIAPEDEIQDKTAEVARATGSLPCDFSYE